MTIWGALDTSDKLLKMDPTIKRMATPGEIHKLFLLYFTGLLPFVDFNFQAIWMPSLTQSYRKLLL